MYDTGVSARPRPLDGYIRVSQVAGRKGDRFQSPKAQRDAIEGWARAHGVRIAAWHEDLDRSGGTMDRPGMNAARARIASGATGGIVVARLDRFARSLLGGLATITELHDKGARVVSVAENVDPATPMGRALLGLILLMAQLYLDQADEGLGAAQLRAASAGRFPGRPSYGYARDGDGLTVVDEQAATVVRRVFRARAGGTGWRAIADQLIGDRILTPAGRDRWAPSTVQGIIRSEASLGVFVGPRGLRVEDAWPAIVDRELWEAANRVRGARDASRRYHDRLFAGLARCASCRLVLARTVNPEGFVSYGCTTRGCKARTSVGAGILDEHVGHLVDERLARLTLQARPTDYGGEADRLARARDAAVAELEVWRDDVGLRAGLGDHDWREGLLARARARDDAEAGLADYRASRGLERVADVPDGVVPRLEDLAWKARREIVEALVHSVWVRRSSVRGIRARQHVGDRLLVVWRDDPRPPELPGAGAQLAPLEWQAGPPTRSGGPGCGGAGR